MDTNEIRAIWITVNRKCNFRCQWCYAEGTEYDPNDDLSIDNASELFRIGAKLGAKRIIILGGEPTLWSYLPDFIHRMNKEFPDIEPVIVTNGYMFSNSQFRKKFENLNFKIGLSLKAGNDKQHKELTKTDALKKVKKAISLLTEDGKLSTVSVTISSAVIDSIVEMVKLVKAAGGENISFEMCSPTFDKDGNVDGTFLVPPQILAEKIVDVYPEIDNIMNGNLSFHVSTPLCMFPDGFIETLEKKDQIVSGCHVLKRTGVVFNTDLEVLLCNHLHHIPIGAFGVDFHDPDSFINWWNKKEVKEYNNRVVNYPAKKCQTCKKYTFCGGGCPMQWFYYNPNDVITNNKRSTL